MSDVRRNSGLFVHYSFLKDYIDAQNAQNKFLKDYCDNLNNSLYNQSITINKLESRISVLEQKTLPNSEEMKG